MFVFIVLVFAALVAGGVAAQDEPLKVLATTTLIADVAQNVGGDLVVVSSLLPPNTDTHAYEPTPSDAVRAAGADLLLVNGAGYEAFLTNLLANAGSDVEPVVVSNGVSILGFGGHDPEEDEHEGDDPTATEGIGVLGGDNFACEPHAHEADEEDEEHEHGACDPHVWMNPQNVKVWASNIADAFAAADPANAETYRANAAAYAEQLDALDAEVADILSIVPEERRILVTNHEFMGYFAEHYDFEIVGTVLPSLTTDVEVNPQQLAAIVELVEAEGVPAIFAEVSANPQLAQIVAQETGIEVINTLYSESLSEAGGAADTYLNFLRYDAQVIADALSA